MTNPCSVCGDVTDHASDEALCRCMAMLDGITKGKMDGMEWWSTPPRHHWYYSSNVPPAYLTDPKLGMEALEELLRAGYTLDYCLQDKFLLMHEHPRTLGSEMDTHNNDELQHAIMRARHALKLAQWEEEVKKDHWAGATEDQKDYNP